MEFSYIDNVLKSLEYALSQNKFKPIETEFVELKDLTTGNEWKSLKETICAYLNSNGGYVICGIRERNGAYNFSGYPNDQKTENNIVELQIRTFRDDKSNFIDLTDYITLSTRSLLDKPVLIIYIRSLPDDLKYVFFDSEAYIRILSRDKKVTKEKIAAHKEYKENELIYSREITTIPNASLEDLDIIKINHFIELLNRDVRIQSYLPDDDIERALPFLHKQHFINKDKAVTILGLIVCGKDPFQFLEFRTEVGCFVESLFQTTIAQNKRILKGTVLYLMEESLRFLNNNIQFSLHIESGGTSQPEYPERVLRESVNNALVHRDYQINKNIDITIKPNKQIEVKNPGSFKTKLLLEFIDNEIPIRRIIPGNAGSKNPKLANILKVFDKWEGKGWGMATLVNSCLDNMIDLPYYKLGVDDINLIIPKGKLLDEETEIWLASFEKYITKKLNQRLTFEQKLIISYLFKSEVANKKYQYTILLTPDNNHLDSILVLKEAGIIIEHPNSTNIYPIFIIDRNLIKRDFTKELEKLYGQDYALLNEYAKKSLHIIFRHTLFNEEKVSARDVAYELFLNENKVITDQKKYINFVRRISDVCSKLARERKMLIYSEDKGKKGYLINTLYISLKSLFD